MTAKRIRIAIASFFIALGLTAAGTAVAASTAHASTTAAAPQVYYHT